MTNDSLFELLKEDKNVKITINIKRNTIVLHKIHDTFYRIIIDGFEEHTPKNIVTAIDLFLLELNKLKRGKRC